MILAAHIVAGAAVAAQIHNPALLAASALATHVILDPIPHWDYELAALKQAKNNPFKKETLLAWLKIIADIAAGLAIALYFFGPWSGYLAWGIFWANLPDLLLFTTWVFPAAVLLKIARLHHNLHYLGRKEEKRYKPLSLGLATQIAAIVILAGTAFITF